MFPMLSQIYEVSTAEEARAIAAIGVDHIGVLVGEGEFPRELPLATAADIAKAIVSPSKFSALFLTANLALIEAWARELRPSIVHLGAAPELLSPADAARIREKLRGILLMRSVPVFGEDSIAIARGYDG